MCKVSVLMSTYKETESYLRQAIESILDQTFKDFEFIIKGILKMRYFVAEAISFHRPWH